MNEFLFLNFWNYISISLFGLFYRLANFSDAKMELQSDGGSGINEYVHKQFDPSLNWSDVEWLVK